MEKKASGMAIAALVLGCASFFCGGCFFSIPAIILGKMELGKIDAGQSSEAGRGLAKAGMIIGIVNLVVLTLALLAYFLIFGLAMLGSM